MGYDWVEGIAMRNMLWLYEVRRRAYFVEHRRLIIIELLEY